MAEVFDGIDERLAEWIAAQPLFFVATAPMSADEARQLLARDYRAFAVLDTNGVIPRPHRWQRQKRSPREERPHRDHVCAFTKRPGSFGCAAPHVVETGSAEFSNWPIGSPVTSAPMRSCASPWTGCPTPAVTASRQWSSFASARTCPSIARSWSRRTRDLPEGQQHRQPRRPDRAVLDAPCRPLDSPTPLEPGKESTLCGPRLQRG